MRYNVLLPLLVLAACAPRPATAPAPAAPGLYTQSFGTTRPAAVRTLTIVLHSDSPDAPPTGQYEAARAFAAAIPNSVAVAILRPGYDDEAGNSSPGERGLGAGDNYDRARIDTIAATIRTLQRRYPAARTVLVGQSGGAAVAANLLGTQADIADAMLLIGCPCLLDEWRTHMKVVRPALPFDRPTDSLDPVLTAGGVPPRARVAMLVGADDTWTPQRFSRGYAEALALRGVAVDFAILNGRERDILNSPETITALQRLVGATGAAR